MSRPPLLDIRDARLGKVAGLRARGLDPYPARSRRTRFVGECEALLGQPTEIVVAGRLMRLRRQGALCFAGLQDRTGSIQLYVRRDTLSETEASSQNLGYADLNLLDVGDHVEARGTVVRTERGELSILVAGLRVLAKSLRPLPDKWAGITDEETLLRRRYLQGVMEPPSRDVFDRIGRMLFEIRRYLDGEGFVEFHTPVLQPLYGGGTARPFRTHLHALDTELFLAISHELYLKRLIAAGFERVYTVGRYFRNEGIDATHHPEFSMVETMTAFANYEHGMDLVEGLFRHVAVAAFGKTRFDVRGQEVDLGAPWRRASMSELVAEKLGVDLRECDLDAANGHLTAAGVAGAATVGEAIAAAFGALVEKTLIQPTLVYGHPMAVSPLAKPMAEAPDFAERFEILIGGMECGDNWSEQNDPVALHARWRDQRATLGVPEEELHPMDLDFLEMLEYGMPPTTGIGPGIERMAMILGERSRIDEVLYFPLMRPTVSRLNRLVYEVAEADAPEVEREEVLTLDELVELWSKGRLRPHEGARVTVIPHLTVWGDGKASASAEVRWPGTTLRVAGCDADGVVALGRLLANVTLTVESVRRRHVP